MGRLDRIHVHAVGEDQQPLARIAALLRPPGQDLFPARDRRRGIRPEPLPVGQPVRRIGQKGPRPEGVRQGDQQVAVIGRPPFLQHLIGRGPQGRVVIPRQGRQHHGQFMTIGADRLQIIVHGQQDIGGADEG
ncbi:hypothetical protein D3C80_1174970 [compost metagenome]